MVKKMEIFNYIPVLYVRSDVLFLFVFLIASSASFCSSSWGNEMGKDSAPVESSSWYVDTAFFCRKGLNIHEARALIHLSHDDSPAFLGQRSFWEWHLSQAARSRMSSPMLFVFLDVRRSFGHAVLQVVYNRSRSLTGGVLAEICPSRCFDRQSVLWMTPFVADWHVCQARFLASDDQSMTESFQ